MFVHSVYFWLREDSSPQQVAAFRKGLEALRPVESVKAMYIGAPAATDRPIIDRSYSFALTVVFADPAGQEVYQVHPLHKQFVQSFSSFWRKIVIYDAV